MSGLDEAFAVAIDSNDRILVAGYTTETLPGQTSKGGFRDAFIRAYRH